MIGNFIANTFIKFTALWLLSYGTGSLVFYKGIKVNYTRKINHFALFFLPLYLDSIFPYRDSMWLTLLGCILTLLSLTIYIHPIRTRFGMIGRMFLSFDRPEDRPHTLIWLSTQIAAGYLVIIPMIFLFVRTGFSELIFIPILINGIGDGLAEPVGIRFGKHEYRTRALFSTRRYVRTLEGSACVFVTSMIVMFLFQSSFTQVQFLLALAILPASMTLAEAVAPHTWDTPVLFLAGYTLLFSIKSIMI